jgi:hypothetical protein
MPQLWPTTCPHAYNSPQPLAPGTQYRCRGCGAILTVSGRDISNGAWPTPNAAPNLAVPSEKALNATYPGQFDAISTAAAAAL